MASICLRPEAARSKGCSQLIDLMADEREIISFAQHLTVCGVPGDLAALDAAAAYVRTAQ